MVGLKPISELKIRASYGSTGNFNIGDFDYLGKITGTNYSPNNVLTSGQTQSTFENTKLGWEKTISYDFGTELGLFNNRINIVFDYYDKRTSGLLYNVTIPAITGFTSSLFNIGEVQNKGVELEVNTRNLTGPFSWQTSFNLASNRNKVTDLGGINERINTLSVGMAWILRVGEPMFSYYGYRMIGMLNNAEDVASYPVMAGSKPGNPRLEDVNNDGVIDPNDRVILGNFMPKVTMGMTNDFAWKRFDLSIAMQTSLGAKVYNYEDQYYSGTSLCALRRSLSENEWWSEAQPGDGKTPARALRMTAYHASTSHFIQSASFFFVRNVNFGYTLPVGASGKIGVSNLRLYTSVNNPVMIKDKGNHTYNPEGFTGGEISGTGSNPGNNQGSEPVNVVVTFGINASF
jgi:outer membrane receptor protein involved in Fe transport